MTDDEPREAYKTAEYLDEMFDAVDESRER